MASMGTLSVKADPQPQSITISGPEFFNELSRAVPVWMWSCQLTHTLSAHNIAAGRIREPFQSWKIPSRLSRLRRNSQPSICRATAMAQLFNFKMPMGFRKTDGLPATVSDLPSGKYQVSVFYHSRTIQKTVLVPADTTDDIPFQFRLGAARLNTVPIGAEVHTADGNYLGQTPLLLPDMTPRATQFTLSLSGFEPVAVTLKITADQTNSYAANLVGIGYLPAIRDAKTYLTASNFEAAYQAATAALSSKPGDADALSIQSEANKYLDAARQQQEMLERPKKWFDNLCAGYPDANLFATHELETGEILSGRRSWNCHSFDQFAQVLLKL